jgi:hypothetical protein
MTGLEARIGKRMILPLFSVFLWGVLLWLGLVLREGVVEQHVAGYPNQAQTVTFIVFPAIMTTLNLMLVVFAKRIRVAALVAFTAIQVPICFATLMMAGGGV